MKERQKEKYNIGEEVNIGNFHAIITGYSRDRNGLRTYKYKCLKCGYDKGEKSAATITNGFGCPCCANRIVVKGINDIATTDPWMIPFFQGGEKEACLYTKSCKARIIPRCPDCGRPVAEQKINNIYNHKGVSCVCKDGISFPNKIIYFVMEQLLAKKQISYFQREYYIQKENKFYDIYFEINSKKYFVEMDGGLGHGYVLQKHDNSRSNDKFKIYPSSMFREDVEKERLAESLDVKLIRIDCYYSEFEYIKSNILNSELKDVVDLELIDWTLVEKQSYSNLMKTVCDYRHNNPDAFVKDAVEQFNLNAETIRRYWTSGNELGWCVFDRKTEDIRSRKARTYFGCKVVLEKIETLEKIEFNSMADFVRKNTKYFDKPFTRKTIATKFQKCNNFIKNYEGYNIYKLKQSDEKEN